MCRPGTPFAGGAALGHRWRPHGHLHRGPLARAQRQGKPPAEHPDGRSLTRNLNRLRCHHPWLERRRSPTSMDSQRHPLMERPGQTPIRREVSRGRRQRIRGALTRRIECVTQPWTGHNQVRVQSDRRGPRAFGAKCLTDVTRYGQLRRRGASGSATRSGRGAERRAGNEAAVVHRADELLIVHHCASPADRTHRPPVRGVAVVGVEVRR